LAQTVLAQTVQEIFPKVQLRVKCLLSYSVQLSSVKVLLLKPAEGRPWQVLQPSALKLRLRWVRWTKISCVLGWLRKT